jgi:hypothetical protein
MLGIDRKHEAVEKVAALGGRTAEQSVHRRHEPDDAEMIGECCGGRDRLAVDAVLARGCRILGGRRLNAGPQARQAQRTRHVRRHRPGAVALGKGDVFERRAPQAAPGCEKRDRLDEIGLAGAIRSGEHHERRADVDLCGMVAAEIRQSQATDAGGGRHAAISNR